MVVVGDYTGLYYPIPWGIYHKPLLGSLFLTNGADDRGFQTLLFSQWLRDHVNFRLMLTLRLLK